MRNIFGGNANTAVFYAYGNLLIVAGNIDDNFARRRVFDGIFNQIANNFPKMVRINIGIKNRLQRLLFTFANDVWHKDVIELLFASFCRQTIKNILQKFVYVDDLRVVFHSPIFYLADIKEILE